MSHPIWFTAPVAATKSTAGFLHDGLYHPSLTDYGQMCAGRHRRAGQQALNALSEMMSEGISETGHKAVRKRWRVERPSRPMSKKKKKKNSKLCCGLSPGIKDCRFFLVHPALSRGPLRRVCVTWRGCMQVFI